VTYFKPFKNAFRKKRNATMAKKQLFLIKQSHCGRMGGQSFPTIFEKKNIKFRFKVCGIWSLNSPSMVGKFSSNEVFIAIEKEEIYTILIQ
jgi:hypothetical protein